MWNIWDNNSKEVSVLHWLKGQEVLTVQRWDNINTDEDNNCNGLELTDHTGGC